jgi:hypothetical protein
MATDKEMTLPEFARHYFDCDPEAGLLTWRFCRGGRAAKGRKAGAINAEGYLRVVVSGREYLAHRLVWAWVHGETPDQIDHINGDRSDNRIENLRSVDGAANQQNRRVATRLNPSGYLGVSFCKQTGMWKAAIRPASSQPVTLGRYATPEEASRAYTRAKLRLHPGYVANVT